MPFALVVVRALKGVDVRTIGSGNVGATNASRAFASKGGRIGAFLAIYLLDAAKGFAPAWFGPALIGDAALGTGVALGAAAILGHVFTPFLGFRGGKGVALAAATGDATGGLASREARDGISPNWPSVRVSS